MKVNQLLTEAKRSLPTGYTIVPGPNKKFRFVKTPDNKLIPNQGSRPHDRPATDEDIISDFYIWYDKQAKTHRVPSGSMPKAELSAVGKSANPEKGKVARKEHDELSDPFAYPGDEKVFDKCNYDKRIKQRKKGEKADPNYLGDILHFVHERDGKLYGFGSDNKVNLKNPLGTVKVVGTTLLQHPMTELWHDAQALEVHLNVGGIIPAARLRPTSMIGQNYAWKAYVPSGWEKIVKAVKNASASQVPMDELVDDALKSRKKK